MCTHAESNIATLTDLTVTLKAALEAGDRISRMEAYSLVSINLEKLLGLHRDEFNSDLVAVRGGDFLDFNGKVVAIISPSRGVVDLL